MPADRTPTVKIMKLKDMPDHPVKDKLINTLKLFC